MVIMGIDSKTDMWLARRKEWHGIGWDGMGWYLGRFMSFFDT